MNEQKKKKAPAFTTKDTEFLASIGMRAATLTDDIRWIEMMVRYYEPDRDFGPRTDGRVEA